MPYHDTFGVTLDAYRFFRESVQMKTLAWIIFIVIAVVLLGTWIFKGPCVLEATPPIPTFSSYLCLTSTPSRLLEPWIWHNIVSMKNLQGHGGVVLSLPWTFAKTGEAYIIPEDEDGLEGIRILRCDDQGPGTKFLAPLKECSIPEDRILMFCDDDIRYKPHTFLHLLRAILKEPEAVHSVCEGKINGYLGFGAYKRTMLPVLQIEVPSECRTVDDNFLTTALSVLGVPLRSVSIPGCVSFCQACAYDMPASINRMLKDRGSLLYKEVLTSNKRSSAISECTSAVQAASV
jgi:hypothetical protein